MDPLTGIGPAVAVASGAAGTLASSTATVPNADFDTFLRMLTAQMRNQDPLNPTDPQDFATQLATFSAVEQQVQTNKLLTGLGAQMAALGMAQISGWIGLEAEAQGRVLFTGDPVSLSATVDARAEAAALVVTDAQGAVVQRVDIPAQSGPVVWTGRETRGLSLPDGSYQISVHSLAAGETVARHDAQRRGRIEEARLDGGDIRLVLDSGQSVRPSEVTGLRPASE